MSGSSSRGSWLSLCLVLTGALVLPMGLRAVNGGLPDAPVKPSYLPSVESPRVREPFDAGAASALREAQPNAVVIGDSMAGTRLDPRQLSTLAGKSVAALFAPGTPVAYWYLEFKNLVVDNDLAHVQAAIFFFRDDQLTSQVDVTPGSLDRVARDEEPELDRVLATHRLGALSGLHRAAGVAYQFDRTRQWLEPGLAHAPIFVVAPGASGTTFLDAINTKVFPLDALRGTTSADMPEEVDGTPEFSSQIGRSVLPEIVRLAEASHLRLAFIRVQRRPTADGPPAQSATLTRYLRGLRVYLEEHGAYYHDDWGDPDQPLAIYADGDHIVRSARQPYTERFFQRHAALFR